MAGQVLFRLAVVDLDRKKAEQLVAGLEYNNPDGTEIQARHVDLSDEQATIRFMEDADVVKQWLDNCIAVCCRCRRTHQEKQKKHIDNRPAKGLD